MEIEYSILNQSDRAHYSGKVPSKLTILKNPDSVFKAQIRKAKKGFLQNRRAIRFPKRQRGFNGRTKIQTSKTQIKKKQFPKKLKME